MGSISKTVEGGQSISPSTKWLCRCLAEPDSQTIALLRRFTFVGYVEVVVLRKLLSFSLVLVALTFGTAAPAFANPGQVPNPPPATDAFSPGKACTHANLVANRAFDANHATGVLGAGTPPTCGGGGGGG